MGNLLEGKVAVVTGGGRGIGKATARLLAQEKAIVMICARSESELQETVSEIQREGGQAGYVLTDLAFPDQIRLLVSRTIERFGRIDILVNNASLLGPKVPLAEYPLKDWEEVLQVNLTAVFYLTQNVLNHMRKQKTGCIINVTSSVGRQARAGWGAYAISKFGLEGFTQLLAQEEEEVPIRVIAFNPGGTRSRMRAAAYPEEDPAKLMSPETVAEAIGRLILNEDLSLSGKSFNWDAVPGKEKTG